jgi:hypothetical protein
MKRHWSLPLAAGQAPRHNRDSGSTSVRDLHPSEAVAAEFEFLLDLCCAGT